MAKKKTRTSTAKVYGLETWLADIAPRVWRRFAVPASIKLPRRHDVIQDGMGWTNLHLHTFMTERQAKPRRTPLLRSLLRAGRFGLVHCILPPTSNASGEAIA